MLIRFLPYWRVSNNLENISGRYILLGLGISLIIITSCQSGQPDNHVNKPTLQFFTDVTAAAGVTAGHEYTFFGSDYLAMGQAWADYDQDGWVDLYLTDTSTTDGNKLFRNNGDGTYDLSPLAEQVTLTTLASGGTTFADYDNDGWPDLYVAAHGTNVLFHNEQGQGFRDVTTVAGVGDTGKSVSASWGDYDLDGLLDLYVANWQADGCDPTEVCAGSSDRLYHNNGDGRFLDVTASLGLTQTLGAGFVATFVDYDNDRDPDIYLVNDQFANPIGNVLWRNDGPGCVHWCFTDVSVSSGTKIFTFGMGLATSDYDNDGDLDFYFSNMHMTSDDRHTLLQNQGDGTFRNVASLAGVDVNSLGWGSLFFDFDNDGWRDLFQTQANGMRRSFLFQNMADGRFTDVSDMSGIDNFGRSMGVAYADYDQDGWLDLVIGNGGNEGLEGFSLYHNEGAAVWGKSRGWLQVQLDGAPSVNRDAIGARVYLTTADGLVQMQEVKNGSSLGAGNELLLHFGLGEQSIIEVKIVWPDGHQQRRCHIAQSQRLRINYLDIETLGC